MLRRRAPSATRPSRWMPSSSGPRCAIASSIALATEASTACGPRARRRPRCRTSAGPSMPSPSQRASGSWFGSDRPLPQDGRARRRASSGHRPPQSSVLRLPSRSVPREPARRPGLRIDGRLPAIVVAAALLLLVAARRRLRGRVGHVEDPQRLAAGRRGRRRDRHEPGRHGSGPRGALERGHGGRLAARLVRPGDVSGRRLRRRGVHERRRRDQRERRAGALRHVVGEAHARHRVGRRTPLPVARVPRRTGSHAAGAWVFIPEAYRLTGDASDGRFVEHHAAQEPDREPGPQRPDLVRQSRRTRTASSYPSSCGGRARSRDRIATRAASAATRTRRRASPSASGSSCTTRVRQSNEFDGIVEVSVNGS